MDCKCVIFLLQSPGSLKNKFQNVLIRFAAMGILLNHYLKTDVIMSN